MERTERLAGIWSVLVGTALLVPLTLTIAGAQGKDIKDVYEDKCSVCHGVDGAAKTAKGRKLKVKDIRQTITKQTTPEMIEIVVKGKAPDMDGFGKEFSAAQIAQLVEYYRGLAKK